MLPIGALLLGVYLLRRSWRWYRRILPPEGRDRFVKRVLEFVESKKFEYIDLDTYGLSSTPFEGHVGLHEMAHALTYVNFTAHEGRATPMPPPIIRNFGLSVSRHFSGAARPLKASSPNSISPYAPCLIRTP